MNRRGRPIDRWNHWHLLGALVMAALAIAATFGAWADIYHIASVDEEYSHIFLVPIVALWLIWVRRMRFRHCSPSHRLLGPLFVLLGWGIGAYGFRHGIQSLWHGGAVIVLLGAVVSVLGKSILFRFFPALLVLVFLVPAPGRVRLAIAQPLQARTAQIAQALLEYGGVETTLSGNQLSIKGTNVLVAEACNGLRMVLALILVSYTFSFGLPLRNWVRLLILLASPLAAIACNVIRILPTVWLYGNAPLRVASTFHQYAGWTMLPAAFLMLLGIIKMLQWAMIPVTRYTLAAQPQ